MRHGETSWNVEGRYQGHSDVPLSSAGREQARSLRLRLEAMTEGRHLFDPRRTAVLSSDLARARETCELAFGAPGRAIQLDTRLREIGFGVFEGLTRDEIDARHPEQLAAWQTGDLDFAVALGESRRDTRARARAAILAQLARAPHEHVVVVTHGGVLRQLLSLCFDDGDAPLGLSYGNTVMHRVHVDDGVWSYDREI